MSSSWDSPGSKSKVVDTHYHIAYFYGFLSAIFALGFLLSLGKEISYQHLGFLILGIALTVGHFKVSDAAESDKNWVPAASTILSVPLLLAFPIGTFFGVKLLINVAQLKPAQE
jgi:hypothetical protein